MRLKCAHHSAESYVSIEFKQSTTTSGSVDHYLCRIRNDLIGYIWYRVDVAISPGDRHSAPRIRSRKNEARTTLVIDSRGLNIVWAGLRGGVI